MGSKNEIGLEIGGKKSTLSHDDNLNSLRANKINVFGKENFDIGREGSWFIVIVTVLQRLV